MRKGLVWLIVIIVVLVVAGAGYWWLIPRAPSAAEAEPEVPVVEYSEEEKKLFYEQCVADLKSEGWQAAVEQNNPDFCLQERNPFSVVMCQAQLSGDAAACDVLGNPEDNAFCKALATKDCSGLSGVYTAVCTAQLSQDPADCAAIQDDRARASCQARLAKDVAAVEPYCKVD